MRSHIVHATLEKEPLFHMCVVCVCCVSFASRVRFVRGRGIYRIKAKFLLEQMSLSFSIVDGIRRSIVYMREHN